MIAKAQRTRIRLTLAAAGAVIVVAVAVSGISHRWFRAPYPFIGKQIAWRLGVPEAGYNFDAVVGEKFIAPHAPTSVSFAIFMSITACAISLA